jgi:hypothetical protein
MVLLASTSRTLQDNTAIIILQQVINVSILEGACTQVKQINTTDPRDW